MARMRDETKRLIILQSSKMLFSQKGFFHTSISDIVRETGLPVGTIYTYFKNKDEIVRAIVEEGWTDLFSRLEEAISAPGTVESKLKILIEQFIPELLNDLDLINILLSEAIKYTRIEEKAEKLTDLVSSLLSTFTKPQGSLKGFSRTTMKTALAVYFLGLMNTVKIARSSSIDIKISDVINFLTFTAENALGIKL